MQTEARRVVRRLWEFCTVLRDDGLSYPDYVEQLTYLLFLKMSEERTTPALPAQFSWRTFASKDAKALHKHYADALAALGRRGGMLGLIFRDARNKIRDPQKLKLLVTELIGSTEWSQLSPDVKGDAYEGLLEKNARDTKSGAGQYFTPRPLIDAIVKCVDPSPKEVISDPACGTGGFLLAAHAHVSRKATTKQERNHLATRALRGTELVPEVARLAAMNLLLHGVGGAQQDELPIACADSLARPGTKVDVVMTNPPFGVKGTVTYRSDTSKAPRRAGGPGLTSIRNDFWVRTANKQLNFVQHVANSLKPGGRAAMVVPDNVLFETGVATKLRRKLLETCDVHTLLRLPAGLFYAQSVSANVLFFSRAAAARSARDLLVYDLRDGVRFSRTRPLQEEDLRDFVRVYQTRRLPKQQDTRWRLFSLEDVLATADCSLSFDWPKVAVEPQAGTLLIDTLSRSIMADLEQALAHMRRAAGVDE